MTTKRAEALCVAAPNASNKSLIKNQQYTYSVNYKSFFDEKRKKHRHFCSFCEGDLFDDSIIYKNIAACDSCLWIWATLKTYLHDNKRISRKPKVIKMHKCFICCNYFGAMKMSSCLVICKECISSIRQENNSTKNKLIEKVSREISEFLRRRII